MIVTVTLNAALDVTYEVDELRPHHTHRVAAVSERAGGKGVNVARLLHALGEPVVATGLLGGGTGTRIRELLVGDGVPEAFVPVAAASRRTLVIADGTDATGFWEPGPVVSGAEWHGFTQRLAGLLAGATAVVLSGSLPRGLPDTAYAEIVGIARRLGVPVVLDADGAPLRHGVAAGPDVVKPNETELRALTGGPVAPVRELGAAAVVASFGAGGLVAATAEGAWRARLPEPVTGNPTGAGDACVAALVRGLVAGRPWPERLADAVALSAAAVLAPVAGSVDVTQVTRLRPTVEVVEVPGSV